MILAVAPPLAAQEDVYVDAPIETAQPGAGQAVAGPPASNFSEQYNWGLINYGFLDNVYYQYSGNRIFKGGNSPSTFINIGYLNILPIDLKYMPGLAYGGEFQYHTATSEDVYAGDDDTIGPSIDMSLYITNVRLRLFFMDPFKEKLQPFFGLSWGILFGDFDTTKVGGDKYSTYFSGMTISRNFGVQIKIGNRGGLITEFRSVTANAVKTSNDPFDQGSGDSMTLDFSGNTVALTGYYRF